MAGITAAMVKELRDRTGQAMMDCKAALTETGGDVDKAIDLLRKKGMAVLEKREGRQTNEGRVVGKSSDDGKTAVLSILCSETDFTAKTDDFIAASEAMAEALLNVAGVPESAQAVGQLQDGSGRKIAELVDGIVSRTGEKVEIGNFAKLQLDGPGLLYCYVHFNGKIGTLVQIDADDDAAAGSEAAKTLGSDIAMHITATNPSAVCREDLDKELVAHEESVARSQVENKPANIIDKIVLGKMNKWYQQVTLLEQPFVKDDSKTVKQVAEEAGKQAGGKLDVSRFARLQIG